MPFTALNDDEEKDLYRLQLLCWREALRCENAKCRIRDAGFCAGDAACPDG
jgi:hypothetical protein